MKNRKRNQYTILFLLIVVTLVFCCRNTIACDGESPPESSGIPEGSAAEGGGSSSTGSYEYDSSWGLTLVSPATIEMSPGDAAAITVKGGFPEYEWRIDGEGVVFQKNGSNLFRTRDSTVFIQASDELTCSTTVTVQIEDKKKDMVEATITIPSEITLAWDYGNSSNTITANGSGSVAVIEDGGGPYFWEVTRGSVFFNSERTQDAIETTTNSTTLYAQNACGAIEISVTDICGNVITRELRAPGKWVTCGDQDCNSGWNPQSWGYIYPFPGCGYRIEKYCTSYNSKDHRPCTITCGGYSYTAPGTICQPYPLRTCGWLRMQIWKCP